MLKAIVCLFWYFNEIPGNVVDMRVDVEMDCGAVISSTQLSWGLNLIELWLS